MSDFGLYQRITKKLSEGVPEVSILGQEGPDVAPPHIRLQIYPLEKSPLPQKAARAKIKIILTSCYLGDREIQDLHGKVLMALEGAFLSLEKEAEGLLRFEESQIILEKDGFTRIGEITFTALIKFPYITMEK